MSAESAARVADARNHTGAFSWLVTHRPAALVVWRIAPDTVAAVVPQSVVLAAAGDPCAQAKARHAAVLLVASTGAERDRALGCGVALYRDAGAVVVAPL